VYVISDVAIVAERHHPLRQVHITSYAVSGLNLVCHLSELVHSDKPPKCPYRLPIHFVDD
jgi:hypothetical protein